MCLDYSLWFFLGIKEENDKKCCVGEISLEWDLRTLGCLPSTLSKCFRLHSRKQSFVGGLIRDMGKLCYRLVDSKEAA